MSSNIFRQALEEGQFVYSVELTPGRDHAMAETQRFIEDAGADPEGMRVISVTDLPGGHPALPPEFVMTALLERDLTPVAHLTGKDGNRNFLEGRLHGFARLGVENILALTGDAPAGGFDGRAKPVYDLDSVLLLQLIAAMRTGIAGSENGAEAGGFDFFPGAVVNPYKVREADQMMQFYKLELKIASGARFIITQLGYNLRKLYELKQYLNREGLGNAPVIANIYMPTRTIGKMMQAGAIAGCVMPETLLDRLAGEKKPQRLERAALMAAAVRSLGFAGAHLGGYGLTHRDARWIVDRAAIIGEGWRARLDELIFPYPGEFYLLPQGTNGLSDPVADYQTGHAEQPLDWTQRACMVANRLLMSEDAPVARFMENRLTANEVASSPETWRHGFWYRLLGLARLFKSRYLGCVECGDCIQDHLLYSGCTMARCYKELRNGPCGGSRVDGTCEMNPAQRCVWASAYEHTLAAAQDPEKFARTLIPPRNWALNRTNSLANRLTGRDNYPHRRTVEPGTAQTPQSEDIDHVPDRGIDQ